MVVHPVDSRDEISFAREASKKVMAFYFVSQNFRASCLDDPGLQVAYGPVFDASDMYFIDAELIDETSLDDPTDLEVIKQFQANGVTEIVRCRNGNTFLPYTAEGKFVSSTPPEEPTS